MMYSQIMVKQYAGYSLATQASEEIEKATRGNWSVLSAKLIEEPVGMVLYVVLARR